MITDITTATPQEIDAELYRIQIARNNTSAKLAQRRKLREFYEKRGNDIDVLRADNEIENLIDAIHALADEAAPLNAEFCYRGGWTRAHLVVTNGTGHVHRTMACTTCYATTQFHWLTELSDHDEQEIVDLAGERACTVCYASAPVELRLDRETSLFTEDEKAKLAVREERAAKKAAANATKITVEGYNDLGRVKDKEFKTSRAITNMIAGELSSLAWYGTGHPSANEWASNVEAGRKALTNAGIEYDYDKALAAARKKVTKEGGEVKY